MLGGGPTTPEDYPQWSGFGRRREREWGHRRHRRRVSQETPPMRIYIIGNDGITLCREAAGLLDRSTQELRLASVSGVTGGSGPSSQPGEPTHAHLHHRQ